MGPQSGGTPASQTSQLQQMVLLSIASLFFQHHLTEGTQEYLLAALLGHLGLARTCFYLSGRRQQTLSSNCASPWMGEGPGNALIEPWTLKGRSVSAMPGTSLTSLSLNTSPNIVGVSTGPFFLLITHTVFSFPDKIAPNYALCEVVFGTLLFGSLSSNVIIFGRNCISVSLVAFVL